MSSELQRIRDDYLARLRFALRGVTNDVTDEVVWEIEAHIEDAMSARGEAEVGALLDTLDRLGPPESYARGVALYSMVDLGYRRWSLRHMVGSARFWALSTLAGAVVVAIFGLLYLASFAALALGAQHLMGAPVLPGVPTAALITGGLLAPVAITVVLRWFIGQYVQRARPEPGWSDEDGSDGGWVRATSRRILGLALVGLVVAAGGALASGALRVGLLDGGVRGETYIAAIRPAAAASPAAWVGFVGLAVFFLAPVIGLISGVLRERLAGDE